MSSHNYNIETERLMLRLFEPGDAAAICRLGAEPAKSSLLPDWSMAEEAARGLIGWFSECWARPDPRLRPTVWAVAIKENSELIGHVGVGPKQELGGEVEIGYAVSAKHAGRGLATEAARAAARWAFEQAGLDHLAALVLPENTASARVLEKLGFVHRGFKGMEHFGRERQFCYYLLENSSQPASQQQPLSGIEPMAAFFDLRAEGYEAHMKQNREFDNFYAEAVAPIPETLIPIEVLDLGCGTGLELKGLFERAPNARVTCVDLSQGMLEILKENYKDRLGQLTVVQASYVDWQYPEASFDYALSVYTMHHFLEPKKVGIYQKIAGALKPGGAYIEADYMVDGETMDRMLKDYYELLAKDNAVQDGACHVDIPFTPEVQRRLLHSASFAYVHTHLEKIQPDWSGAILVANTAIPVKKPATLK